MKLGINKCEHILDFLCCYNLLQDVYGVALIKGESYGVNLIKEINKGWLILL